MDGNGQTSANRLDFSQRIANSEHSKRHAMSYSLRRRIEQLEEEVAPEGLVVILRTFTCDRAGGCRYGDEKCHVLSGYRITNRDGHVELISRRRGESDEQVIARAAAASQSTNGVKVIRESVEPLERAGV